jgi:hypothetical protein
MRILAATAIALSASAVVLAQADNARSAPQGLEYRVKAEHLVNFTKFVDWPDAGDASPLSICVAEVNPFGTALSDLVSGEHVNGRLLQARVVRQTRGCHVLFIPKRVAHGLYLRAVEKNGLLTVGETPAFLNDGGIINFVLDQGRIRFEIDQDAAVRANLVISSRLLRLALRVVPESRDQMGAR